MKLFGVAEGSLDTLYEGSIDVVPDFGRIDALCIDRRRVVV